MKQNFSILGIILALLLTLACSALQTPTPMLTPTPTLASTLTPTEKPHPVDQTTVRIQRQDMFCPSSDESAQKAFNDAVDLETHDKLTEAEALYRKAIELDPRYCDAMDNLGRLLRQQGQMDEAIAWYKKSLEILPTNTVALQNLASAYRFQSKPDQAIREYEKLIEIAPDNPEGYFGIGSTYYELKQPVEAIKYLKKAEELYSKSASPYITDAQYYLGMAYFMSRDCGKAKEYLDLIYVRFAEDGSVNYVLGMCALEAKPLDMKLAKEYILKAQDAGIEIPTEVLNMIEENQ